MLLPWSVLAEREVRITQPTLLLLQMRRNCASACTSSISRIISVLWGRTNRNRSDVKILKFSRKRRKATEKPYNLEYVIIYRVAQTK
jgi:hypothetical protein